MQLNESKLNESKKHSDSDSSILVVVVSLLLLSFNYRYGSQVTKSQKSICI